MGTIFNHSPSLFSYQSSPNSRKSIIERKEEKTGQRFYILLIHKDDITNAINYYLNFVNNSKQEKHL